MEALIAIGIGICIGCSPIGSMPIVKTIVKVVTGR